MGEGQTSAGRTAGKTLGLATKVSAAFGVFSAFNLVAHTQNFMQISESVHWMTGWWRYLVGSLFAWFRLDIGPLTQDALVVLGLAVATANLTLMAKYRITFWGLLRGMMEGGRPTRRYEISQLLIQDLKDGRWMFAVTAFAAFICVIIICVEFPLIGILLFLSLLASGGIVYALINDYEKRLSPLLQSICAVLAYVIAGPAIFVVAFLLNIAHFWRQIAYSAGVVILLLAMNVFFEKVFDPLAPLVRTLPSAPGASAPLPNG